MLLGRREQPRDPLRRDEAGEHSRPLRPRRREELLSLGQAVRADVRPHGAVVDGDDLGRARLPLRAERREAVVGDPVDRDPVEDADRERAHDGLRLESLAGRERHAAPARRDADRRDLGAEANPLSELGAHPQRDLGAPSATCIDSHRSYE